MNHNTIYLDLTINNYTYHLGRIKDYDIIKLANDLNMNYKIITRKKLQSDFEKQNNIEGIDMIICEMKKPEENLFSNLIEGTTIQKTTD